MLLEWAGEETRHTAIQVLDGDTGRPLKSWRSSDLRSATEWGTSFFITDDIDDDGDKELVVSEGGKVHFVSF